MGSALTGELDGRESEDVLRERARALVDALAAQRRMSAAHRGDLVTVGETMSLVQAVEPRPLSHARYLQLGVAGAESHVAIGVRRLGHESTWIGRIGVDEMGDLVVATLRGEPVVLCVDRDPVRPTGLMITSQRTSSTTKVSYYRVGSAASALRPEDVPLDRIAAAVLHVTGITAALSPPCMEVIEVTVAHAARNSAMVGFDVNHCTALWTDAVAGPVLRQVAATADMVFAGEDEAAVLLGVDAGVPAAELAAAIADLGPAEVLIKRGAAGALAVVDGQVAEQPGSRARRWTTSAPAMPSWPAIWPRTSTASTSGSACAPRT